MLKTTSYHLHEDSRLSHKIEDGWRNTSRSAAICWGEGNLFGDWAVIGEHKKLIDIDGQTTEVAAITEAVGCNITDGWFINNIEGEIYEKNIQIINFDFNFSLYCHGYIECIKKTS